MADRPCRGRGPHRGMRCRRVRLPQQAAGSIGHMPAIARGIQLGPQSRARHFRKRQRTAEADSRRARRERHHRRVRGRGHQRREHSRYGRLQGGSHHHAAQSRSQNVGQRHRFPERQSEKHPRKKRRNRVAGSEGRFGWRGIRTIVQ